MRKLSCKLLLPNKPSLAALQLFNNSLFMKPFFYDTIVASDYITIVHFRSNNPATAKTMTITTGMIPSQVLLNIQSNSIV
jgi:CDP-glycerol glycerophosphotransferase (TagB/SpsB family)